MDERMPVSWTAPDEGENVTVSLTIETDENGAEFIQEWLTAYADKIREGMDDFGLRGEMVLTVMPDGVFEYR